MQFGLSRLGQSDLNVVAAFRKVQFNDRTTLTLGKQGARNTPLAFASCHIGYDFMAPLLRVMNASAAVIEASCILNCVNNGVNCVPSKPALTRYALRQRAKRPNAFNFIRRFTQLITETAVT